MLLLKLETLAIMIISSKCQFYHFSINQIFNNLIYIVKQVLIDANGDSILLNINNKTLSSMKVLLAELKV